MYYDIEVVGIITRSLRHLKFSLAAKWLFLRFISLFLSLRDTIFLNIKIFTSRDWIIVSSGLQSAVMPAPDNTPDLKQRFSSLLYDVAA